MDTDVIKREKLKFSYKHHYEMFLPSHLSLLWDTVPCH